MGCRAPARLVNRERVRLVWAVLRLRHPLLASSVKMHDYDDVRFMCVACSHQLVTVFDITDRYLVPRSVEHALDLADLNLEYRAQAKDGKVLQAPGVHMCDEYHRAHRFIPEWPQDTVE